MPLVGESEGNQGINVGTFSSRLFLRMGSWLLPAAWLRSLLKVTFALEKYCRRSKCKFVPFLKWSMVNITETVNTRATHTHEHICK